MEYDFENDEYICALGRLLKKVELMNRTSKSRYISQVTKYECESCEGCSIKNRLQNQKEINKFKFQKNSLIKKFHLKI